VEVTDNLRIPTKSKQSHKDAVYPEAGFKKQYEACIVKPAKVMPGSRQKILTFMSLISTTLKLPWKNKFISTDLLLLTLEIER